MSYSNIRELLPIEGRRVLLVSQQDEADWLAGEPAYILIGFDDGTTLRVIVEDDERVFVRRSSA